MEINVEKISSDASTEVDEPKLGIVAGSYSDCSVYARGDVESGQTKPVQNFKGVGVMGGTFNLANAALGAGMLTFPKAFANTGIIAGFLMQIGFAAIQWFTLVVLGEAATLSSADSLTVMAYRLLGRKSGHLAVFLLVLFSFFVCVTYLQTIGDQFHEFTQNLVPDNNSIYIDKTFTMCMVGILFVFPMFSLRDMSSLAWVSFIAVAACLYVALFVLVSYIGSKEMAEVSRDQKECEPGQKQGLPDISTWLVVNALPLFCFAYHNQISSIPNHAELTPRAKSKYPFIVLGGSVASLFTYSVVGVAGVLTFGGCAARKPLILQNYRMDDLGANIGRLSVALAVATSYPIVGFTGRQELCKILESTIEQRGWQFQNFLISTARRRLFWVGTFWFIITLVFAAVVNDLEWAFILSGAPCAASIFAFPGLFAAKLANLSHEGSVTQALKDLPREALGHEKDSWAHGLRDRITYRLTSTQRRIMVGVGTLLYLTGIFVLILIFLLSAIKMHDSYCPYATK